MPDLFPETETPIAKKRPHTPCPWRSCPPQSGPERLAILADLRELRANRAWDFERFAKTFAMSIYALSGEELEGVVKMVEGILEGDRVERLREIPD